MIFLKEGKWRVDWARSVPSITFWVMGMTFWLVTMHVVARKLLVQTDPAVALVGIIGYATIAFSTIRIIPSLELVYTQDKIEIEIDPLLAKRGEQ